MLRKPLIILLILMILLPGIAVFSLYQIARATKLPGRRGGPQDAFRHVYSTSLTAKYISPRMVELVTFLSERDENSQYDRMDIHNNRIGIKIGLTESDLYIATLNRIKLGQINSSSKDTVTWLPENKWDNGL